MNRQAERKRAIELKAADARKVLEKMPFVLQAMTPEQIDQVQRLLDSNVVNPVVEKEWQELDRKTIRSVSGSLVHRLPDDSPEVIRRNKKWQEFIRLEPGANRIRLNLNRLLDRNALTPESDNPDEASYHLRVRKTLAERGVWLRFGRRSLPAYQQRDALPDSDPNRYSVALSVGPEGNEIPTTSGLLTRDSLRRTNPFATDYWDNVFKGPTQKLLDRTMTTLKTQLRHGMSDHRQFLDAHDRPQGSVARSTSEAIAGVDLPDYRMWTVAEANLTLASKRLDEGKFAVAEQHIQVAATMIAIAGRALAHYMKVTSDAASKVVTVLQYAEKAGEIAGMVLVVRSVGMRIVRAVTADATPLVAEAGASGGVGASATRKPPVPQTPEVPLKGQSPYRPPTQGPKDMKPSPVTSQQGKYPTNYHGHEAYDHTLRERQAYEIAVQRGNRTAGGTAEASSAGGAQSSGNFVMNRQELSYLQRLDAWNKEYFKEMADYMRRHPRLPSYNPQMELIMQRLDRKWGVFVD